MKSLTIEKETEKKIILEVLRCPDSFPASPQLLSPRASVSQGVVVISPVSEPASLEEDVAATNRLDLTGLGTPVRDREEAE